MIYRIALSERKTKGVLDGAGHLIYSACDNNAHRILYQDEVNEKLALNGFELDPSSINLTNSIIDLIAEDYPNERIRNELAVWRGSTHVFAKMENISAHS